MSLTEKTTEDSELQNQYWLSGIISYVWAHVMAIALSFMSGIETLAPKVAPPGLRPRPAMHSAASMWKNQEAKYGKSRNRARFGSPDKKFWMPCKDKYQEWAKTAKSTMRTKFQRMFESLDHTRG
jgi:hypothetical protein